MATQVQLQKDFQFNGEVNGDNKFHNGQLTSQKYQYSYNGYFEDYLQNGQGFERYKDIEYEGYFRQGEKSGEGQMQYQNCTYEGAFQNGMPHGKGELRLLNNEVIQGTFQMGDISSGKMLFRIRDRQYCYIGPLKYFQKSGEGKVYKGDSYNESNLIYNGSFVDNYPTRGLLYDNQKQIFKGDVNKNYFPVNGHLDIQNKIGEYYKGGWEKEKKNGEGHFIWKNKSEYQGKWKDSMRDGYGVFTEYDEQSQPVGVYKGYFCGDKREDQRPFFFSDEAEEKKKFLKKNKEAHLADSTYSWHKKINDKNNNQQQSFYMGNWKNGYMDGKGYIDMVNYKYEGYFVQSKKEGKGKLILQNQDWYEGNFRDNKFDGHGQFHFVETGDFYNGNWSQGQYEGEGTLIYTGGLLKFVGNFRRGVKEGPGQLFKKTDADTYQLIQDGTWRNDEFQNGSSNR